MKLKSFLIALLSGGCILSAQAQWRLGAEVGIDLSSVNNPANHTQIGEHGGLTVDYAFKNKINLSSGIYYTMKGANSIRVNSYDLQARLGYLELPIMVGYRIPVAPDIHLIPAVGAYFAWGVNGNGDFTSAGNSETATIEWNKPFVSRYYNTLNSERRLIYPFDHFDSGLRFGLSAEIHRVSISFNYDLGLKDMWRGFAHADMTNPLRNRNATLAIGYRFEL